MVEREMHQIQSKSTQFYSRRAYLGHVSSKARHLHLTASLSLSLHLSFSLSPTSTSRFRPVLVTYSRPDSTISVVFNRAFVTSFAPTIAPLASRSRRGCDWSVWKVQDEYRRLVSRPLIITRCSLTITFDEQTNNSH